MKTLIIDTTENLSATKIFSEIGFEISLCITWSHKQEYAKKHNIAKIQHIDDLIEDGNLKTFSSLLASSFLDLQEKVEFSSIRMLDTSMIITDRYYKALCYFDSLFKNEKFDCVVGTGLPHGFTFDIIAYTLAKKKGIATYHLVPIGNNFFSIFDFLNKKSIKPIDSISPNDLNAMIADTFKTSYNKENISLFLRKRYGKSYIFTTLLHRIFGQIFLVALSCLKRREWSYSTSYGKSSFIRLMLSYLSLKKMNSFYKKNAKCANFNDKYIFYAVHFEPEAATNIRTSIQNQLTIIRLLSRSIPSDWKLYIKEHPHQFDLNNCLDYYFLTNIEYYKDVSFYEECLKLPNVVLIDQKESSRNLIKNSQLVSTINGSIILESIFHKKQCIIFDNTTLYSNPYVKVFESFCDLEDFFKTYDLQNSNLSDNEQANILHDISTFLFHRGENEMNIFAKTIKSLRSKSDAIF